MSKKKLEPDTVVDEQGRQRFHGAFTGGFSAGYYNTVGSEEGFKPATFVSSRNNRYEMKKQSINEFMDESDGLIGGVLATHEKYDTFDKSSKKSLQASLPDSVTFNPSHLLTQLILPASKSIGKELLLKLGWKPGQGIGARKKIVVPTQLNTQSIPKNAFDVNDKSITAAPKEEAIMSKVPTPKVDSYGLGYDESKDSSRIRLTNEKLLDSHSSSGRYHVKDILSSNNDLSSRKLILQSGYIDDAEDDIYDNTSFIPSKTKTLMIEEVPIDDEPKQSTLLLENRSAPSRSNSTNLMSMVPFISTSFDGLTLDSFITSTSLSTPVQPTYPHLEVPKGFIPNPRMIISSLPIQQSTDELKPESNEKFAFLAPHERARLESLVQRTLQQNIPSQSSIPPLTEIPSHPPLPEIIDQPLATPYDIRAVPLVSEKHLKTTFSNLSQAFKSRFVSSSSANTSATQSSATSNDSHQVPSIVGLTTVDEYSKKFATYLQANPSETHSTNTNQPTTIGPKPNISCKFSIKPVRTTQLWVPERLLCKRFNVPLPDVSRVIPPNNIEQTSSYESKLFSEHIGKYIDPITNQSNRDSEMKEESYVKETAILDSEPMTLKASKSLFASIFDSDEDDDNNIEEKTEDIEEDKQLVSSKTLPEKDLSVSTEKIVFQRPIKQNDPNHAVGYVPLNNRKRDRVSLSFQNDDEVDEDIHVEVRKAKHSDNYRKTDGTSEDIAQDIADIIAETATPVYREQGRNKLVSIRQRPQPTDWDDGDESEIRNSNSSLLMHQNPPTNTDKLANMGLTSESIKQLHASVINKISLSGTGSDGDDKNKSKSEKKKSKHKHKHSHGHDRKKSKHKHKHKEKSKRKEMSKDATKAEDISSDSSDSSDE